MKINLKKLKGFKVYEYGFDEPLGQIKGINFSRETGRIESLHMESLSIIPLKKSIRIDAFDRISNNSLVLKKEALLPEKCSNKSSFVKSQEISWIYSDIKVRGKLRDVKFDFETGEIAEFVVQESLLKRPCKLEVNKMQINENTIYVETKGGS